MFSKRDSRVSCWFLSSVRIPVVVLVVVAASVQRYYFHNYYQGILPLPPRQSFLAVAYTLCLLGFFGSGVYTGHRAYLPVA